MEGPPPLARQASTVFRELGDLVLPHLSLADLALVILRINRSFSAMARARIAALWPSLEPLFEKPFLLDAGGLLTKTSMSCNKIGVNVQQSASEEVPV